MNEIIRCTIFEVVFFAFYQPMFLESTAVGENANPEQTGTTNSNAMECSYPPEERVSTAKDIQQIQDLESRVKNLKKQVITALDQAQNFPNSKQRYPSWKHKCHYYRPRYPIFLTSVGIWLNLSRKRPKSYNVSFTEPLGNFYLLDVLTQLPMMQVLVWMRLLKKFELMNEWWSLRELLLA
jgi:hypothetical protein